ncbi:alpha-hydroxy-acid oxidizing protein [Nocardia abscessus]|uniref:alpha-hydroxy-acid oxidizing protein n=1 Tax=Nocardia abscessus TaxID=120957 RepID=UPI0024573DB1|nr:alpha-hydroxy-acid oxidizing protein [Nocardia abscessus]
MPTPRPPRGRVPLLLDSEIRIGSDVSKPSSLGTDAVTIGRPRVYGLALSGWRSARGAAENIVAELDPTFDLPHLGTRPHSRRATPDLTSPADCPVALESSLKSASHFRMLIPTWW